MENSRLNLVLDSIRAYAPDRIYVFGSWARGEEDDLSDLDLVLIKETKAPFLDRLHEVARLLPKEVGGVDILVYTSEEFRRMQAQGNAFIETVLDEGRLIYER
jgi:uncharacterized protein